MTAETIQELRLELVYPNPDQPRKRFDTEELVSLAESIQEHDLLYPVKVKGPDPDGNFMLVDGERRWRACKMCNKETIRALVSPFVPYDGEDKESYVVSVITNMQRANLNPLEEAMAIGKLRKIYPVRKVVSKIGKSIGYVQLRMKLLELDPEAQQFFATGAISCDNAILYSLAKMPAKQQVRMTRSIAQSGMSVDKARRLLKRMELKDSKPAEVSLARSKKAPAVEMSAPGPMDQKIFKMLADVGSLPQWALVESAARETCDHCELNDVASTSVCRDCPAVELIKRMVRIAGESKAS